ncbi:MAG: ADOP family duplicated permease [Gemmatimonadaceae bacterium]
MRRHFVPYPYPEPGLERWLADLRQDLHYALRQVRRAPGFAAIVVGTLAVGIGANVMMASVLDALLFRPPPGISDAGRLAQLVYASARATSHGDMGRSTSYPAVLEFARDVPTFADVAAYDSWSVSLGVGPDALRVRTTLVTPNFFTMLGVHPALGRLFSVADGFPTDGGAGGPPLVVLAYGFWQRQFAGDRSVLGRSVSLGSLAYTIVGVAAPGFRGVQAAAPDVWLPVTVTAPAEFPALWSDGAGSTWLTALARLKPGVSRAIAAAQATAVMRHSAAAHELDTLYNVIPASVIAGRGPDAPQQTTVLIWLGGLSVLVLLIACANVANLMLGRAVMRRREVAVRLALGVGRGRLARQLFAESLVLVSLGGAAACYLAVIGSRALQVRLLPDTGVGGVLNVRLIGITALIALGVTVVLAMAPWLQSARLDLMRALKGVGGTMGVRTARARTVLLGMQAVIGMVLLVMALLAVQSLRRVLAHDLGVDLNHTAVVYFDLERLLRVPGVGLDSMYGLLAERLRALPGVERVALADAGYGYGHAAGVYTTEHDDDYYWHVGVDAPIEAAVDSGFFRTMGAHSLRGRDFDAADRRGAPRVAIINQALGHYLWPGRDALGQCLLLHEPPKNSNGPCVTVVGVIPTFQLYDMFNQSTYQVYVPLAQNTYPTLPAIMYIRVRGETAAVIPSVRRAILTARPDLPAPSIAAMESVVAPQLRPWRLAALLFSLFGTVAVLIAMIGLYGVVSFAMAQRASEIAIRRTLGADTGDVLRVIGGDALRTVAVALIVGAAVIVIAHGILEPVLYRTSARDPWIIGGAALTLLLVAVAACAAPTVRAVRTNPAVVLRGE